MDNIESMDSQKAKANLRVPVVIYNKLSKTMECRLFIDINTKQRPVPNELLLDIKKLAEVETNEESLQRDVFDKFSTNPDSPLFRFDVIIRACAREAIASHILRCTQWNLGHIC
jgi:hypothetical protein